MSIQSELSRISNAKNDIANAIRSKDVNVPENVKVDKLSEYTDNILSYDESKSIMINNNNELIPIAYSPDGDCSYTFSIANYIIQ